MNHDAIDDEDPDARLAELDEKETMLTRACQLASAKRVAEEIRRVAKAQRRLIPYINATFTLMNNAQDLLEPDLGRDASLELIGLLESEDRARAIQPDLPEAEYEQQIQWYSSCGYDNLAKATAILNGYNSEGMHACIADGIAVCRRTGKMQCVTCFREYAMEVYLSADDVDMAQHYALVNLRNENGGPHDRRWSGAGDMMNIHLLNGDLESAIKAGDQMLELCDAWHSPRRARLLTANRLREIALLAGKPEMWSTAITEPAPAAGEFLMYELTCDQTSAIEACCGGNFDLAIDLLVKWDKILTQRKCLERWFHHRLQLLATYRLAGQNDAGMKENSEKQFSRLAAQLEAKAKPARDWFTLNLLERLRDEDATISPYPTMADLRIGPFAPVHTASSVPVEPALHESEQADAPEIPEIDTQIESKFAEPLIERLDNIYRSDIEDDADGDSIHAIISDLLAIPMDDVRDRTEILGLMTVAGFVVGSPSGANPIWVWAKRLAAKLPDDAVVTNVLADLGARLLFGQESVNENAPGETNDHETNDHEIDDHEIDGSPAEALIDEQQLEQLFRRSLELDAKNARNFWRAGDFFGAVENVGEAERCYARAFRLDRSQGNVATKLARIYQSSDRPRDALAVLDMAIREGGGEDPGLCMNAAMLAHRLDQHESALAYLDAYEARTVDPLWANYYRSASLLALGRPDDALGAIAIEASRNPDIPLIVAVHQAAAHSLRGDNEAMEAELSKVLATKLYEVENLTQMGLANLLALLIKTTTTDWRQGPIGQKLGDYVIQSGLAPDELFAEERVVREKVADLNFYECVFKQPLDQRWATWPGRLVHEDADCRSYRLSWGVLSDSEESATELVVACQARSFPLAAELVEVTIRGEGYFENPGVVWQGFRTTDP